MAKKALKMPSPRPGMTPLGRTVWLKRQRTNRTLEEFSRDIGLSQWTVCMIENGRISRFHPMTLDLLAAGLGLTVEDVQQLILPEPDPLRQEVIDAIETWMAAKIREAKGPGNPHDDGSQGWLFADFLQVIYDHCPDAVARMLQSGASAYLVEDGK